jgi:hypothetical protein
MHKFKSTEITRLTNNIRATHQPQPNIFPHQLVDNFTIYATMRHNFLTLNFDFLGKKVTIHTIQKVNQGDDV